MDREKIAKKIRELRGEKSREEVAIACGVTAQAICMYETGVRIPNDEVKIKLCNYFGVTVQEVFFDK